jgi:serine protease Do
MNKTLLTGFGIFALAFAGVAAALQWDRHMAARRIDQAAASAPGGVIAMPVQAGGASAAPVDFRAASKALLPSVVRIDNIQRVPVGFLGRRMSMQPVGSGSGVVIDAEGYIITNSHVVKGAEEVKVTLAGGSIVTGRIIGSDPKSDLALVQVEAKGLKAAPIGDSKALEPGQWVLAIGSPLGYDNTVSVGVVSATGRVLQTENAPLIDAIQTDAAINPGNSGGALATADGRLVGINTAILSQSGGSIGLGFAIPMSRAQQVVQDFLKFGRARYGFMNVRVVDGSVLQDPRNQAILREEFQIEGEIPSKGVLIDEAGAGGPAAKAGLRRYDVVLAADGKAISTWNDFQVILLNKRPGDVMKLKVWSRGETKNLTVTLGDEPV